MKHLLQHVAGRWTALRLSVLDRPGLVDRETGLRRLPAFRASAEMELARAARFHRPLALVTVAVDPAARPTRADAQRIATILRHQTRGFDLICRTDDGGFMVLLPEAGRPEALVVADRIQRQITGRLGSVALRRPGGNVLRLSAAVFPDDGMLLEELVAYTRVAPLLPPATAEELAPPPRAEPPTTNQHLRRFVLLVAACGLSVLAAAVPRLTLDLLVLLAPFLLLAILAERWTNLKFGEITLSLSGVAVMAAAALGGPAAGAVVGAVNGLAAWHFGRQPALKGTFNVGLLLLSAAATGLPYWAMGGLLTPPWSPLMVLPGLAAGLLGFVANHALLAMVVALATGTTWWTEWRLRCTWLVWHYGVMGVVSLGLAILYQTYGLSGLLLLLGPVGVLYYAQRQYITNTVSHIDELSSLNQELRSSNQRLADSNEQLAHTLSNLSQANESLLITLCEALELRDQETEGHSRRVVHYAQTLARALLLPAEEIKAVTHGALLHDIGKIGVPDAILLKPGSLTPDEWVIMKRHPEIGYRLIAHIPFLAPAAAMVRHHHERWDGKGYPSGLAGADIPLGARIFAVVDTFDAMTSNRPYRPAMTWEVALAEIERSRGTQFDPEIATVFGHLVVSGELRPPGCPVAPADEVVRASSRQRVGTRRETSTAA